MDFTKKITFRRALLMQFKFAPLDNATILLIKLISLVMAPISVLVTAYFINTALAVFNEGLPVTQAVPPLITLAAFQVFNYFVWPFNGMLEKRREIKLRLALRLPFVEKRARLEYRHMENNETVDLMNRVWQDPEGQLSGFLNNLLDFCLILGQSASYATILLINAPLAGLLLMVLSVPVFFISFKGGKQQYQANRDMTQRDRRSGMLKGYLTSREAAAERSLFGYTTHIDEMYIKDYEDSRQYRVKTKIKWFIRAKGTGIIIGLLSAAALFLLIPSVANGSMTVGLYISLIGVLFASINWLAWSLPYCFENFAIQREYLKDLNHFFTLSEVSGADDLPVSPPLTFTRLEFRDVSFTYPGTDKKILDKISFTMEQGKHYSFVGVNGAGKTTLTKLITRLYDDYEGEILLNNKPLRSYSLCEVKAAFCAVFQDFARYDVTVAENVAIGRASGAADTEIDQAIALAGFTAAVDKLKDGKNTMLGKTQDEGVDLSGGEWQRIAFARAIISPAPVKILDEPTAALDPVAESQMYTQFEEISRGFTTIFISHRLASAKMADVIFVLENGCMAEQGSHSELMQAGGLYAEMFESQRSWYL